jgi:peptidoglycan/xylan/chitin deacetylase (PgdA/CDA1 family)
MHGLGIDTVKPAFRTTIKHAVEFLGTAAGPIFIARRLSRHKVTVLAYHNVVPAQDAGRGDSSLHLPLETFVRQIDQLSTTHEIVDLDTIGQKVEGRRPRAVITFDDAYRGAVTLALPELIRRGLPAVVFVAPALLGATATWWDQLAELGLLSEQQRLDALTTHSGRTEDIMRTVRSNQPLPQLPASYGIATLAELREYCTHDIRIGSHTWGHECLPRLSVAEIATNLKRTSDWIRQEFAARSSSWIALPYGEGSETIGRTAVSLGHTGVFKIAGGLWNMSEENTQVPRLNVPAGMSYRGLALRTSGLV